MNTTMKGLRKACALLPLAVLLLAGCGEKKGGSKGGRVGMLKDGDKQYVAKTLAGMKSDVRLVLFASGGTGDCQYCGETEGLLADIAAAAPRVKLEVLSLKDDAARARELGIDKVPGTAILGAKDHGLRYFGLPSGYDFIPFVETLRSVANDDPELAKETVAMLATLKKPVQLSVFVTQH
jgi:alkyl hydroperoxide reductase subunit AhpF